MPPSASKSPLSPAELAQLEHAFATDPTSEAYKPLAEAYLAMGRFMEAMVVCKKGVKAHPETVTARVLLARVYSEQGKDKKALEELQGALTASPNDLAALRLAGALLCKSGDLPAGTEHLKKAIAADPKDPETVEMCRRYNVAVPAPEPPPPPPAPAAPTPVPEPRSPVQAGVGAVAAPGLQRPISSAPAPAAPPPEAPRAPQVHPRPAPQQAQAQRPAAPRQAPPVRSVPKVTAEELHEKYGEDTLNKPQHKRGMAGLIATVAIILISAFSLGGFFYYRQMVKVRDGKIAKLMKVMQDEIGHDSYAGYKKACEAGTTIVSDLNPDLHSAHAYLAYAYAIRWGEHGEGEDVKNRAEEHLKRAKDAKLDHSHILAAEAYIRFFGGDTKGAEDWLEQIVEDAEKANKKSTLLMSVLGILQMHAGDLDKAFKNIKGAQTLSPADPRINAALGDVYRRQGNEMFAAKYYEDALRYERDHAEAQLGVTLMAIDTGKFEAADRFVKRLLALDPPPSPRQMAVARMAHAIVLDEQGKALDAEKEQTMALETDSRNPELFMLKARRQLRASKQDEALASIREAIKRDPKRASFRAELAKVLITKPGGSAEAVKEIQEAIKQMGDSPKLLVILGDAQRADKDLNGAQASYEKALSLAKDKYPEARLALADVAREKKDWTKALELYEKAKNEFLSSARKQAYALVEMGKILDVQQQNKKDALERYKAAANADSTYAPPLFLMSQFFIGDKDKTKRDTAYGLLEKCIELDPKGEYAEEAKRLLADKK